MSKVIAVSTLLASSSVFGAAGDLWLNVHIASSHSADGYFDKTYDWEAAGDYNNNNAYHLYNEDNPGLGLIYEVEDFIDARAGAFKNSYYETSVYAGAGIHTPNVNPVSVGIMLGGATGYEAMTEQNISILVMPYLSLNTKYVRIEVSYIPSIGSMSSATGLSTSFTF